MTIIRQPSGGIWGNFVGQVDLRFPVDAGQGSYAFGFVAPVCGIE